MDVFYYTVKTWGGYKSAALHSHTHIYIYIYMCVNNDCNISQVTDVLFFIFAQKNYNQMKGLSR